MNVYELRDPDEARRHILQSLWLARIAAPDAGSLSAALAWAMELASEHHPLPPVGFVADVGHVALGSVHAPAFQPRPEIPDLDATLVRKYEDYVLGKLYADMSFDRGADALLRYQGRDRDRGMAFLINQFCERAGVGGVILVPTVIRAIQQQAEQSTEDLLTEGWQSIDRDGLSTRIVQDLAALIDAVRDTGEVLGAEDVFELEHGTALAQFGQRLALRQVVQAAEQLERRLPREKVRPRIRHRRVVTPIIDEDLYPVGGYAAISTKGTIESLLHSQLSYMEREQRPDLFDIKFLRDELYYYSRDENQFLRRRQTFMFAIYPDLVQARFKDTQLPWQRIVLVLAVLVAAVRKLSDWLGNDALVFEFLLLETAGSPPLTDEQTLLETLLAEQIAHGTATVETLPLQELGRRCDARARHSLCHCLAMATRDRQVPTDLAGVARMMIDGPRPLFAVDDDPLAPPTEDGVDGWAETLKLLLEGWI